MRPAKFTRLMQPRFGHVEGGLHTITGTAQEPGNKGVLSSLTAQSSCVILALCKPAWTSSRAPQYALHRGRRLASAKDLSTGTYPGKVGPLRVSREELLSFPRLMY